MPTSSRRYPTFRLQEQRHSGRDVLKVTGITKAYGEKQVLFDISLSVPSHSITALIALVRIATLIALALLLLLWGPASDLLGAVRNRGRPRKAAEAAEYITDHLVGNIAVPFLRQHIEHRLRRDDLGCRHRGIHGDVGSAGLPRQAQSDLHVGSRQDC